jgi:RND family efflux transporter MFP subunit
MKRTRIFIVATISLALAALMTAGLFSTGSAESGRNAKVSVAPLPVHIYTVEFEDGYTVHERFAGRVVPRRSSDLGFERSATLVNVFFDEGARVEAGEVLAELDVRALEAQRAEVRAQEQDIRSQLNLSRRESERRRKLHESDHVSARVLDEAEFAEQGLEARLAATRAVGQRIDVGLELSRLRAPYAGIIDARYVDEGTVVSPGQPILRVLEDRVLEVRVGIPPASARKLARGSRHAIDIDGQAIDAVLEAVLGSVAPDTRTVTAIFRIEEEVALATGIRSGALARLALPRRVESRGFWLPLPALTEGHRGLWSAYVVVGPGGGRGVVERRQLEVLHTESNRAFVRGTMRDGEAVVATGLHRLAPGFAVSFAQEGPARRLDALGRAS